MANSEITVNSLVMLKKRIVGDLDATKRVKAWARTYGRGPFQVVGMVDAEHVSLKSLGGKDLIRFGSSSSSSLHTEYVEPAKI